MPGAGGVGQKAPFSIALTRRNTWTTFALVSGEVLERGSPLPPWIHTFWIQRGAARFAARGEGRFGWGFCVPGRGHRL